MHDPAEITEVALDLTEDRRHGIARKPDLAIYVEAVDRLINPSPPNRGNSKRLTRASVAQRKRACQRQEPLDQRIPIARVTIRREALKQRALLAVLSVLRTAHTQRQVGHDGPSTG